MPRKKVTFIATRQKNKKIDIHFFTYEGKSVSSDLVKRTIDNKGRVEFYTTR